MWKLAFPFLAALLAVGLGRHPDGGMDANANDPDVQTALKVAIDGYNNASPDIYLYKVMTVIRVQKKAVEGYKYIITLRIARTLCRKDKPANAHIYRCTFVVWSRPWLNDWQLLEAKCH
uniref:Cystatin domain-containing protein n=1 Tax=Oryzias sinensis TaxID=183150 RepID=A0A8C7ZF27_9TELE